jgi:NitT/TauT family transport system permease protein
MEIEVRDDAALKSPRVPASSVGGPARVSAPEPRRRKRSFRRPIRFALVLLSVALLYLLWLYGATKFQSYILPGPGEVWDSLKDLISRGIWWTSVRATLEHVAVAFVITLGIGLPLGIVIGRFWPVEDLTRVPLVFLQTVPTIVLITIALIAIGANQTSVIAVTVASGLTYFTLNVIQGTRSVDQDLIEMAHAYGVKEHRIMRTITLPSVVPFVLAGARITLGVIWQVTLFGEYLMGTKGVGFQVSSDIKLLDTASVFAWGLSIVALTLLFEYGVFRPAEGFLTRHTRRG